MPTLRLRRGPAMDLGKTNSVLSNSRPKVKPSTPHAVHSLIAKLEKIDSIIDEAVKEYRDLVVENARQMWGDVADSIRVYYDKDTMVVTVYSNSPDAHYLEYGINEIPPSPVLRLATTDAQQKLVPLIKKRLSKIGLSL